MLDLLFSKGPHFKQTGYLDNAPHIKASARHVPLSYRSAHHPRIHRAWPLAEIQRISRLSMHRSSFVYYKRNNISRFCRFFMLQDIVQDCRVWTRPLIPRCKAPRRDRCVRLAVPYHPTLSRLSSKLGEHLKLCSDSLLSVGLKLQVQVACKLAAKPLFNLCRRFRGEPTEQPAAGG